MKVGRPQPIKMSKRECERYGAAGLDLACPNCGHGPLIVRGYERDASFRSFRAPGKIEIFCLECQATITVKTQDTAIGSDDLFDRAINSLEDPAQKERDARAEAVLSEARAAQTVANNLQRKADQIRRGEL